jgi:hypothetical protein
MGEPGDPDDDPQRKMTNNLLAIIAALLLLTGGFWIALRMGEDRRIQDCLTAGFRNCAESQRIRH